MKRLLLAKTLYSPIIDAMRIITHQVTLDELKQMAAGMFGDMVKAVVDIDRELLAVDGELHSDLEALLIDDGSKQHSLWGINLYPEMTGVSYFVPSFLAFPFSPAKISCNVSSIWPT